MDRLRLFVRDQLHPLEVIESGMPPKLAPLSGIRALVFDLYGTLLISAACGHATDVADPEGLPGFGEVFWDLVRQDHAARRAGGTAHPEIEVRELWAAALARLGHPLPDADVLEYDILAHECHANPVWPMPAAKETLALLHAAGYTLGIISNAQFYTRPVMEGLFGNTLEGLGFDPGLQVFSFEEGEGKPSPRLFEIIRERGVARGIAPSEILYIGNDFRKDVLPARAAGFRTALFAGDARSLRLGEVSEAEARETADLVIARLDQIVGCLG